MLELLIDNIFVVWVVWWKCYLAYSRHSNVYKPYSFIRVRNSEEKRKDASSVFNVTFHYIDDTTSLNYSKINRGQRGLDVMVV